MYGITKEFLSDYLPARSLRPFVVVETFHNISAKLKCWRFQVTAKNILKKKEFT
jgi:hypothetical protein